MNGEKTVRTGLFYKHLSSLILSLFFTLAGLTASSKAFAQNPEMQASTLIRDSMTAYGNLDLDNAKALLDQALTMTSQLSARTVARIYVSYGLIYVGGMGDNATGQDNFSIASCLDKTVQIDPLYSTPDVEMIFTMSRSKLNAQVCAQMTANIPYARTAVAPAPIMPQPVTPTPTIPQPQPFTAPVAGGLPPCGMHTPATSQRQSYELPLAVQLNPTAAAQITKLIIKYAFDGSTTYFDMPMQKSDNGWATGMLTCSEGQITTFNPSIITYYIEGYSNTGSLICGHGSSIQPYTVNLSDSAAVLNGLPGMPEPQMCKECPPWDQECQAKNGKGIPCFSDEDCIGGVKCLDTGFCESTGDEGGSFDDGGGKKDRGPGGPVPKYVYFNITSGTGGGFFSAPNAQYMNSGVANGTDPYSSIITGYKSGGWGGLPIRAAIGFLITPAFSLEATFRYDISSLWRTQKNIVACIDAHDTTLADGWKCINPLNNLENKYWGLEGYPNGGSYTFNTTSTKSNNAWLVNLRARYRFVNDGPIQVSFFGGVGYGHLFFASKDIDIDYDGTVDSKIVTPGMVNLELGPGFTYYVNSHFGIVLEAPIDLVFGESGSFGFNGELTFGFSFGG
ncbi:MAG: hypothetical protein JXR91_02250 [Deltaproteobacteria bacterium]|nr:hypothetical protein [Deltaproteobacteria bacterium]